MDTDDLRHDDGSARSYEIVDEFWPYDGPHTVATMTSAANGVAQLVRYLNNATQHGVASGPALGRIVGSVTSMVGGLDQLLGQLARAADMLADDPSLYDDQSPREQGGAVARDMAYHLRNSRVRAAELANSLTRASQLGSRLGHRSEGEA